MENTFFSGLERSNAPKHFDRDKKLSEEDLKKILHAVRMVPSSFGLQPFHVYVVGDQETKTKLKEHGFGQPQFEDASHVLVFCGRNDLIERIDEYFTIASGGDSEKRAAMEGYENMMKGFAEGKSSEDVDAWAFRQAYLALGFALAACTELRIDACPMEGFSPDAFNKVLGVPEHMHSVVAVTIGYRKEEDGAVAASKPKVRFSEEDLFTKV